jgi:hypothetical protein
MKQVHCSFTPITSYWLYSLSTASEAPTPTPKHNSQPQIEIWHLRMLPLVHSYQSTHAIYVISLA